MTPPDVGEAIAERTLLLDGKAKVVVRIYRPEREQDGAWVCRCDLRGLAYAGPGRAYGEDSMQALVLAMHLMAVVIENSREAKAGRLSIDSDDTADLGLRYPDDFVRRRPPSYVGDLSEAERESLDARYESEIRPLISPETLGEAIERLRDWLRSERRRGARLYLLGELSSVLLVAQRDEEAFATIGECIALAPDDPLCWARLAGWHFYGHGAYNAEQPTLEAALKAIDTAVEKARVTGWWLRQCLNDRARIVVGMRRYDLLEQTLREILAATPRPAGVPDVRLEDDFLRRLPDGAIDAELLARYRAAFKAQEARRAAREAGEDQDG